MASSWCEPCQASYWDSWQCEQSVLATKCRSLLSAAGVSAWSPHAASKSVRRVAENIEVFKIVGPIKCDDIPENIVTYDNKQYSVLDERADQRKIGYIVLAIASARS